VREHVPVTLADWRKIDAVAKQAMWEEIQVYIYIWRSWKSRLVSEVRVAKTVGQRIDLKPSNIPSIQVWNSWVRTKTNAAFTVSYLQLTTFLFICHG